MPTGLCARYTRPSIQILSAERPDAVCLVVPEPLTCELACQVLEMGYPLIMEKPPGRTVEEIDRMTSAAEAAGVPTKVAFNRRYEPVPSAVES